MTGPCSRAEELGFDAFGAACGLAVIAGALSLVAPGFGALTAALVALAVAGWASLHRRDPNQLRPPTRSTAAAVVPWALLGGAATLFFAPPVGFAPWRALVLGASVVPLWAAERQRPSRLSRSGAAS